MLNKQVQLSLAACILFALAACNTAPSAPRVLVTVTGETEATFVTTESLVYTHRYPGTSTTIVAEGDTGDYTLMIDIATPMQPGTYSHSAEPTPSAQQFNALFYECANRLGCGGVAASSEGSLTISRADDMISGDLSLRLKGFDGSNYGDVTARFTVPPAQLVP